MLKPCNNTIILTLYTLLIVCMGLATVTGGVYGSWWFNTLWALLIVVSLPFLIHKKVHKHLAVMLLHVSFAIILVGALTTHLTSFSGRIHLRKDQGVSFFTDESGAIRDLPFTLTLKDFLIVNYPGTDAVMDYSCIINVEDTAADNEETLNVRKANSLSVSMNKIGKVEGYRFYQSSFDSDLLGSWLLVAYDPYGIAITYSGYLLLLCGLLLTLCSKHTRIRQLYNLATKPFTIVLLLAMNALSVSGQSQPTRIDKPIADDLCKVAVLYNGRICPLNTAAVEFLTKLSGKSTWQGYTANEVFVGWMIYYTEWEEQKIIKVKNRDVQHILGIEGSWASVSDFYTSRHEYKLAGKSNDASLTESVRKAVREVDEKLQVVTMFYNSEMLHIFPLSVTDSVTGRQDALTWHTPGSTELPLGTPEAEFQFINHIMDRITQCILVNDVNGAKETVAKIRLYQHEKAGNVMPSDRTMNMEIHYNRLQQAHWVIYLFLTLSLLICLITLTRGDSISSKGNSRGKDRALKTVQYVFVLVEMHWLSLLVILRWWVSGHVPMSNGAESMLFMAWVMLGFTLSAARKFPILMSLGPVASGFCMLVSTLAQKSPQVTSLMPVLQSPLLSAHVAVVMMSYALFIIVTLLAAYCLCLRDGAKLDRLTATSQLLLYPAVSLLAVGIFVGAVWANISWGSYWSWDPKETWALITLMVYAIPLHRSFMPSSARSYHLYILLSFLTVLITYFGVNFFLPGMHSYA